MPKAGTGSAKNYALTVANVLSGIEISHQDLFLKKLWL
jgi:hypothetical protein